MKIITLGCHPNNLSLFVLRHRSVIETLAVPLGYTIKWHDYINGGISANLLANGTVDVVGTGCTPPVVASAQGMPIHYIAASLPRPNNSALLSIKYRNFNELRGKKIAAMVGSFTDHFIATLLNEHGWNISDIELIDLRGEAAILALQSGAIDAWLGVDPWLQAGLQLKNVNVVTKVGIRIPNRSIFWAHQRWTNEHVEIEKWLVSQLAANDVWIFNNPITAAKLLQQHLPTNLLQEHWLSVIHQRDWGIIAANNEIIQEQIQQGLDLQRAKFIA